MTNSQCCKTCQHLVVPLSKTGKRITQQSRAYRCLCPDPVMPTFPSSMVVRGYREIMTPNDGVDCQYYEKRRAK